MAHGVNWTGLIWLTVWTEQVFHRYNEEMKLFYYMCCVNRNRKKTAGKKYNNKNRNNNLRSEVSFFSIASVLLVSSSVNNFKSIDCNGNDEAD